MTSQSPGNRQLETEVTARLGISYPIIQGPFGGRLSAVELVAAVSNCGGLGSFGAQQLSPQEILDTAAAIRRQTSKPFALNLWMSNYDAEAEGFTRDAFAKSVSRLRRFYDELEIDPPAFPESLREIQQNVRDQAAALLEAAPPVFSFIFGVPDPEIFAECRKRGIVTVGTATTAEEARALDRAGAAVIVASGFEAGGHRASFLQSAEGSLTGTLALVPQVADAVKAPVVAAGGIADARGIVAAFALGAGGAQIGTAFLACEESAATALHREKLFSEDARNTALTRAYSGRLARAIKNRFIEEMRGEVAPYPIQGWLLRPITAAAQAKGRADVLGFWAGQSAPLIQHRKAAELMKALIEGTSRVLDRLPGRTSGKREGV